METEDSLDLDEPEVELDDEGDDTIISGAAVVNRKDDAPCMSYQPRPN